MTTRNIFAHATNTYTNQPDTEKTPEEFLEDIRGADAHPVQVMSREELCEYVADLEEAVMYFAGFDALAVDEALNEE